MSNNQISTWTPKLDTLSAGIASHNNNNRLDTRAIHTWIDDTIQAHAEK
jgi:hypothetical protein